ncbi:MAG TPA: glycosyltransferase family 2 protein [Chloroflexus aurantiacus]|jgi:glycosyltransferase involved in cell wall biosynthesis|uniref:Glycosyl transferase family 2 n=1 Tax=Chloroflexus aurantiacus (strain ATCC 29366 / DSM 635 / J-10-fl) TaxID=324602 RepID=A9WC05_CHLAA|nr:MULTISPECIES: glycosyltransferase family 2 protein [Chloroflexus]ABY36957.1 glycosyl transferase family 2 [Chloroflexus aurantiacus J-10-fl]RMG47699.1 MAG: glycosyltransferase family 2 protein [Chloroflexota bacterium]GIV93277.1 MAG: glycosyl transferase [Chloroflexus sp.]HBW67860.1 glycosyltransferase family 2 protein [Chloroflexus aurantiacus]
MATLSVVIPAYNEEDGIAAIVERVLAIRPALKEVGVDDLECIVVDDGSKDRTAAIVQGFGDQVRLIRQQNRGYGGALKTGFSQARGELIGFLDADSTYPPEYFPAMCREVLAGADIVIGSRMAGAHSEMPLVRRIGNTIFATMLSLVAGVRISDSASGQRVLRRSILPIIYPLPNTLDFTPAMSTRALHEGLRMVEIPIPYKERSGRSKLHVIRDGLRFTKSIVWTALTYNPVRIFGGLGLLLLLLAGLLILGQSIGIALGMLLGWSFPQLFGALVLAVAGVTLYTTGTSFSYLVALFHKRAIRQGLFGRRGNGRRIERHYWWLGLLAMIGGVMTYVAAVAFDLTNPALPHSWFAPVVSAMLVLMGVQLVSAWGLARVLAELSRRESEQEADLNWTYVPLTTPVETAPQTA